MTRWLRKYGSVLAISYRNRNAYLAEVVARALFLVAILFIFFQLWSKVYSSGVGTVAGFSHGEMLWYLAMTQTLMNSFPRGNELQINEEIRSGAIAYQLNKPYDYITYQLATYAGDWLARVAVSASVGLGTAWLFTGEVRLDLPYLPFFLLVAVGAQLLHFSITICISLLAFVVEDAMPFFWINHKLLFTIGGLMIPVTVFPGFLQQVALWLPYSYILYGPARLAVHFDWGYGAQVLAAQAAWIAVCLLTARLMYGALVRRLDIQGG